MSGAGLRTIAAAAVTTYVTGIPMTTAAVVMCVAAIRTTTAAIAHQDADAEDVEVTTDATRGSGLSSVYIDTHPPYTTQLYK